MKNYIKEFMEDNDLKFDEEFLTDLTEDNPYIITDDYSLRKLDRSRDDRLLRWLLAGTQKVIKKPELLPCPFCGGKAKLINTGYNAFYVSCNNCDCSMTTCKTPTCDTKKEAIDLWNTRYVPQD